MGTAEPEPRAPGLSPTKRALLEHWAREVGGAAAATATDTTHTDVEAALLRIWREVLRNDRVGINDNFFVLGGDSITSLQVAARATAEGLRLSSRQVLEAETVRALAALVDTAASRPAPPAPAGPTTGAVDLTPIQRWFFEQEIPEPHHWDQAVVVDLRAPADERALAAALDALVAHHDVLRSRFRRVGADWEQWIEETVPPVVLAVVDAPPTAPAGDETTVAAMVAGQSARIDLDAGRLVSATVLRYGGRRADRMVLAVHHLVVDGVSMRVLLEDLEQAYGAVRAGRPVRLPPRTASFREWSTALHRLAHAEELSAQLDYWTALPRADAALLPVDHACSTNVVADRATVVAELGPPSTVELVHVVPRTGGVQVHHILLAGLILAWQRRTGRHALQLDIEGHGRELDDPAVDVSRTVGWFTAIHPLVLETPAGEDPLLALRHVQEQLAEVPSAGIGYGVLRYLSPSGGQLRDLPQSALSFNYLGRFEAPGGPDGMFGVPVQVPVLLQSPQAPRRYLLEVAATLVANTLRLEWTYSRAHYRPDTVAALLSAHVGAIGELIARLRAAPPEDGPPAGAYPLARIDPRQLAAVKRQLLPRRPE